jgi:hypothetical protein
MINNLNKNKFRMNKIFSKRLAAVVFAAATINFTANAASVNDSVLIINGTGATTSFTVSTKAIPNGLPVNITSPSGFTVSPSSLLANAGDVKVTVSLNSSLKETTGVIVLRSGDIRKYINVVGYGTALPVKDIGKTPVYKGKAAEFKKTQTDGLRPTDKGYTVEFRVKTDESGKEFLPYFVDAQGNGIKASITSGEDTYDTGIALFNGSSRKSIANPYTSKGRGIFYNNDGKAHTYRFCVTPDQHLFVFRDGLPVDTVRLMDYATQPDFATENGKTVENLLKNPGFEGGYDVVADSKEGLLKAIEGWNIAISDRWCSEQFIVNHELDNEQDFNNHILRLRPYLWAASWGNPQITQTVDVAPNETYTLSALLRGGIKKADGELTGKLFIEEVQDRSKKVETTISGNSFETYSLSYTTSNDCKQIRVVLQIGGIKKRGENISPLEADDLKLTGVARKYFAKIGFENRTSELEYFTYDLTGAYAPVQPELNIIFKSNTSKKK